MKLILEGDTNDISYLCDYIELVTFIDGKCDIEETVNIDDADQLKDILNMLKFRLKLYDKYTPYKIERKIVVSSFVKCRNKHKHYMYCLYYAVKGGANISTDVTNIFEMIVDNALKRYINTNESIITSFGQNKGNLKNNIEAFAERLHEHHNPGTVNSNAKDGGVDIITFKPLDERGNSIVILTDATVGKNWENKTVSVKLNYWKEYINFKVHPVTCLAMVHTINTEKMHDASMKNGLIFDRSRIIQFYVHDESIHKELTTWESKICDL